ncbi:endosomal targeting BRO1-like domain-containing protein [Artemisia annua]|uniref:Endosomal targeting BRO1-like domain-containing protein n=1 Tax=Artemisia annua TaxID=35608 RepID=A0A2U1NFH9_ARTAN|nr:endosomal targeting BRO1-like domain-containing protein [Artemisia annua]
MVDIQKLERYLPFLHNLVHHFDSIGDKPLSIQMTQKLGISWTSPLTLSPPSPSFLTDADLRGPKSFQIDNLCFELGIVQFFLWCNASRMGFTNLLQSATLLRRAAGVYQYLAYEFLPLLKDAQSFECPPEATIPVSYVMSLICLAESQIVAIMKAKEQKPADILLSKLHYGVVKYFDLAMIFYSTATKECKNFSPILMEYISCYKVLYELKSYKYMAEAVKAEGKTGNAIALLGKALNNEQISAGGTKSWQKVIKQDV